VHSNQFGTTYHSKFGALQESRHIFLDAGLNAYLKKHPSKSHIKILEVGFGTGLNAWITAQYVDQNDVQVSYTAYEKFPVASGFAEGLEYWKLSNTPGFDQGLFQKFHALPQSVYMTPQFELTVLAQPIEHLKVETTFDMVYYDAFGPKEQPEMWQEPILKRVFDAMASEGMLVTYCAQGAFKRALKNLGFEVQPLPGPPGKREITRAVKL